MKQTEINQTKNIHEFMKSLYIMKYYCKNYYEFKQGGNHKDELYNIHSWTYNFDHFFNVYAVRFTSNHLQRQRKGSKRA